MNHRRLVLTIANIILSMTPIAALPLWAGEDGALGVETDRACNESNNMLVAAATTSTSTTISFEKAVHFLTPDGNDVVVGPGTYEVSVEKERLIMKPTIADTHNAISVQAERVSHSASLKVPMPQVWTDDGEQYSAGVFFPDKTGLIAVGTTSGIQARALRDPRHPHPPSPPVCIMCDPRCTQECCAIIVTNGPCPKTVN